MTPDTAKQKALIAVVQAQDAENAIEMLESQAVSVTRLPSVGGFLGRRNASLLIALNVREKSEIIEILRKTCRQRVAFIAVPIENSPLPMPAPTPVTIGGASIFMLDIEKFEEF